MKAKERRRVVITGIGMTTSIGRDRESTWQAVQGGHSAAERLYDMPGIPDGMMLAAPVDIAVDFPGQLKDIPLCRLTAAEAMADSGLDLEAADRVRIGCSIGGHMGDCSFVVEELERYDLLPEGELPWWQQWLPNTACSTIANAYDLRGPRLSNSTACATGTIAFVVALRSVLDGQCDVALTGSSQSIHPLFAAGFHNMRVLAEHEDPQRACRPFDAGRNGFVMGEGSAMLVIETLDHALARGARIYAEVIGGQIMNDARHVTNLDGDPAALVHLIDTTLRNAKLAPHEVHHVNAHGTGTQQNDLMEARGIRQAFGRRAAEATCVTANKSSLGHLVNASGSVELAITSLALRDGYAPPTINLTDPDPECDIDCIPMVGRQLSMDNALKLSIAFGGHMAAVALRRYRGVGERHSALSIGKAA